MIYCYAASILIVVYTVLFSLPWIPNIFPMRPYLRSNSFSTCFASTPSTRTAVAFSHSPCGSPLMEHGTICTELLLRTRFTLPDPSTVRTYRAFPSWTNQTGVFTLMPVLRKVSRFKYDFLLN